MRRLGKLLGVMILMLMPGCVRESGRSAHPDGPHTGLAVIGPTTHHFGEVGQKKELWHNFVLTNEAENPIRVIAIKSSCGCTWAADNDSIVGRTLAPNENLDFPVFLSTGTQQNAANGNILLNYRDENVPDAAERQLLLSVEATILPDYRTEPREIDFGDIDGLSVQNVKASFRVVPDQLESLEITDVKPSTGILTAEILSRNDNRCEIEVVLDASSFAQTTDFRGHLIIETNSGTLPKAIVPVRAYYVSPVDVQPDSIIVSSDKSGVVEEEIRIVTSCPAKIRGVDAETEHLVKAKVAQDNLSDSHVVTIYVAPATGAAIDERINVELELFPPAGKSVVITRPVSLYRFKNFVKEGEEP